MEKYITKNGIKYELRGEQYYPMHMADGFKANAAFFKLGFLDKTSVALGRQFKEMLPTLWMKAGAIGVCPTVSEDIPDMLIPISRMPSLFGFPTPHNSTNSPSRK